MHIHPLAKRRVENSDRDKPNKIHFVQPQKPSPSTAHQTYEPEGPNGNHDIPPSAMKPAIKHGSKCTVFQGIEISMRHFPKEMQEEGQETKT